MIEQYFSSKLVPTLEKYHLPKDCIMEICEDIAFRMSSILAIWDDVVMRKTVLFFGLEEGTFYNPSKKITVNAFVVVAVRNSLIEDFHANSNGAFQYLNDHDIAQITKQAIEYFSKRNFTKESRKYKGYDSLFNTLQTEYPVAWKAFEELAQLNTLDKEYKPVGAAEWTREDLKPLLMDYQQSINKKSSNSVSEHQSGISPYIGKELFHIMDRHFEEGLFTDSFKHISRNPLKLCAVIEYLLRKDKVYFTTNYFISDGYVARAKVLLRPAHDSYDCNANILNRLSTINTEHLAKEHEMFISRNFGHAITKMQKDILMMKTV